MLDALITTFDHGVHVIIALIGARRLMAITLGLLLSGGSTQFLKAIPAVVSANKRIPLTRVWSILTAFLPALLLNPVAPTERIITALVVGFAAPVLYSFTAYMLDRKFPGAGLNLSGNPENTLIGKLK